MTVRRRSLAVSLAIGAGASLLVLGILWTGALAPVEGFAVDWMQRQRGARSVDPRIVVCAIDRESVDRYGRWPWPRSLMARLVDRLSDAGAKTIAFDVVFSEASRHQAGGDGEGGFDLRGEDRELAAAIERAGNVVLAYFFESERSTVSDRPAPPSGTVPALGSAPGADRGSPGNILSAQFNLVFGGAETFPLPEYPSVEPNLDFLAGVAASQGFITNQREAGVSRRQGLAARYRGAVFPALPLRAVATFLGEDLTLTHDGVLPRILVGERPVETDGTGRLWLSWPGPAASFTVLPIDRVLDGAVEPKTLAGKLVFVGATESGIGDYTATPFGVEAPGVLVQAATADNLLSGRFLKEAGAPRLLSLLALCLLGPLAAFLVAWVENRWLGSAAAIALVFGWPALCFLAFVTRGWHLEIVAPFLAGGLALLVSFSVQVGIIDARARFIRKTFERFVSQAVVEEMLLHPERVRLGGERREMTVLFCDIRGFTSISERLDSEAVTDLLNRFFTPMTRLVVEAGGTLDKYMGDALMAFFGAPVAQPDHAARACRAALAMASELGRLNELWRAEGRLPDGASLGIGIGVNSGPMSVGNMGSEQVFDYTVIGDNVNLGSRVEGLNKLYGTGILVTGATVEAAGPGFLVRELDRVRVKGKSKAVALFELLATVPAPAEDEERVSAYAAALALYRGRRFAEAEAAFHELDGGCPAGDPAAAVLAARCHRLELHGVAADWEPVETLTSK